MAGSDACNAKDTTGRILFYGNLCIDNVLDVAAYPTENTIQRAVGTRKDIGGNGGNSTRVLKQLQGERSRVSWLGPVPRLDEPETVFALAALQSDGVDMTLAEEVGGESFPTSVVITSQQTGSRTIVSTRNGVRELSVAHFAASVKEAFANASKCGVPSWCHLECRQPPNIMMQFADAWRVQAQAQSPVPPLSVEIEKPTLDLEEVVPLLRICDYAFFSQDFVEAKLDKVITLASDCTDSKGDPTQPANKKQKTSSTCTEDTCAWEQHPAVQFMKALSKCVGTPRATWICGWGEHGAFAFSTLTGSVSFEAAHAQKEVISSVGAGDTFIAASIHALLLTADTQRVLNCACAVAGRKVAQRGFAALADALPSGMKC